MVIKALLEQRIKGVKNEKGIYIAPTFPKIIYVLSENNVYPGSEYYWLTELAAKCTANRMVPDYISEKKMKELKEGYVFGVMGCRSALSVWKDPETGKAKFWGRFNCGVCTINLPDVAISVADDLIEKGIVSYDKENNRFSWFNDEKQREVVIDEFWKLLKARVEMCHRVLQIRRKTLFGTKSDVAPILWQHGALARLKKGETIDKLLVGGYSTTSLGYVGLFETVKTLTGESHTGTSDNKVKELALSIVKFLKESCDKWNVDEKAGYSLYGTPEESTTYKFAKTLQKHKVVIPGVNDKNYVINSYHTDITEKVDAFTKLTNEAPYQAYTTGGAISYVEVPNMTNNIPAVLAVLKHIYENIMYAELNCKLDCCMECGFEGEIPLIENEHHKLIWKCPNCGCTDNSRMNIVRRVCGYLSNANVMNQGRLADIKNRVLHL